MVVGGVSADATTRFRTHAPEREIVVHAPAVMVRPGDDVPGLVRRLCGTCRRAWLQPRPAASARVARGGETDAQKPASAEAEIVLERGLDKERLRNWAAAIEVYREALERWPSRVEFSRRLRLCEIHFKLHRRYSDASFRNVLLALPDAQAAELYDEVVERIQSNYVDDVALEPLVRHGLDNLEVALRDPVFLKANAPNADPRPVSPGSARSSGVPQGTWPSRTEQRRSAWP